MLKNLVLYHFSEILARVYVDTHRALQLGLSSRTSF